MAQKKKPDFRSQLLDSSVPIQKRVHMMIHFAMAEDENFLAELQSILDHAATPQDQKSIYEERLNQLQETIQEMESGPLRVGTFLGMLEHSTATPRACVLLEDGGTAYVPVPDEELARSVRRGETVLIEAQGKAVLFRDPRPPTAGEEARFERRIGTDQVEVSVREHERHVLRASAKLMDALEAGEVEPGRSLLACMRRMMAFDAVPMVDGLSHYRYLSREPVPNVVLQRDLGDPPPYIEELVDIVRREMLEPGQRSLYRLRRVLTRLLSGVSGSGKTFSILALWRRLYELMSEVTGVPLEELPPRVMRLRAAQVLSMWLGEADKNIDRFFDEAIQLASDIFTAPDGTHYELPVLCILEEIDGLGRSRGSEPVYDRVMTTLLERLDSSRPDLRDRMLLFVATTNLASQVDNALLRRIGGKEVRFERLKRAGFVAILDKVLAGLPLMAAAPEDEGETRRRLISEVVAWLFPPKHADQAQVEILYTGSTTPEPHYRRDFLTASLVDRAVQDACEEACRRHVGQENPGLSAALLIEALNQQVCAAVEQLHTTNVHVHLDLPDGAHVSTVRRVRQPAVQPYQLVRAA